MEEAWMLRFPDAGPNALRVLPERVAAWENEAEAERWEDIKIVLRSVTDALEAARQEKKIGAALEANPEVFISTGATKSGELNKLASRFADLGSEAPAEIFRTSQAKIHDANDPAVLALMASGEFAMFGEAKQIKEHVSVTVHRAEGEKCARCWRILPEVKPSTKLCLRCTDAVVDWDQRHGH
jgi:isoleucyl-tRNA synthetase